MDEISTLPARWELLLRFLEGVVGKRPADLNAVLFLVGLQELGRGPDHFSKEQKQDLMHVGVCKVLSYRGYYEYLHSDEEGWPHFRLIKPMPYADVMEQEDLLKEATLTYFAKEHSYQG